MRKGQKKLSAHIEALKKAEEICQSNGLKLTKLRKQVLNLIWKKSGYVKAYDLLDELKKIDPAAKPPTIYRTLDFLMENGLIHKIQSLNAFIGCPHPDEHNECYFLICDSCQSIEECCSTKISNVVSSTSKNNNFIPSKVTFEIAGTCQNCLN
tara:strand:- start:111 stop:569 length:459 start_codon:yes stop_codon:yes gene_type:complete